MTATEKRKEAARLMKSRAGKNDYSQEDRNWFWGKPEGRDPGVCDCSNSVRQAIERAAGINITGNLVNLVNLRTGPGADYAMVDTAKAGQVFEAVDTEWFPILVDGRVLWVSNKMSKRV